MGFFGVKILLSNLPSLGKTPSCPGKLPTDHLYPNNHPITDEYQLNYKLEFSNKLRCEGDYMKAQVAMEDAKRFVKTKCKAGEASCGKLLTLEGSKLASYQTQLDFDWLALYKEEISLKEKIKTAPPKQLAYLQARLQNVQTGRQWLRYMDENLKLPSLAHTPLRQRVRQKLITAVLTDNDGLFTQVISDFKDLEKIAQHEKVQATATEKYLEHVPELSSFHGQYRFGEDAQAEINKKIRRLIPYDTTDLEDIGPFEVRPKDLKKLPLFKELENLKSRSDDDSILIGKDFSAVQKMMTTEGISYEQACKKVRQENRRRLKLVRSGLWFVGQGLNTRANLFRARSDRPSLEKELKYEHRIPGLEPLSGNPEDITLQQALQQVEAGQKALLEFLDFEKEFAKENTRKALKDDPLARAGFIFSMEDISPYISYLQGKAVSGYESLVGRTDPAAQEDLKNRKKQFEEEGGREILQSRLVTGLENIEEVYQRDFEKLKKKFISQHPYISLLLITDERWDQALTDKGALGALIDMEDRGYFDHAVNSIWSALSQNVMGTLKEKIFQKIERKNLCRPDSDLDVLRKQKARLDQFGEEKKALLKWLKVAKSPWEFQSILSQMNPHMEFQLDHSVSQLIKIAEDLAKAGDRKLTDEDRKKLAQFDSTFKEYQLLTDPAKKREALQVLTRNIKIYLFGLTIDQEIRAIDQMWDVSSKWATLKGGIREIPEYWSRGLLKTGKNYHVGLHNDFDAYKSNLYKAQRFFREAQALEKKGLHKQAGENLAKAQNIWEALSNSRQRKVIQSKAESSATWFGLSVGILVVGASLATMGVATAVAAPTGVGAVGFLTSLKGFTIGTTAFFLTYKAGAHFLMDEPFFGKSGTVWGSAKHLVKGWAHEMLFFGALNALGAGYLRVIHRALKPGAKAMYLAEASGIRGAKALPKAGFETLPKAVQQEYLWRYYQKLGRMKKSGMWLGGHATNFMGLHGWQAATTPGYNPFGKQENLHLGAFMIALLPMGPIMERYLSPLQMRKVNAYNKRVEEFNGINQLEINWQQDYLSFHDRRQTLMNDPKISLTPKAKQELRKKHLELIDQYNVFMTKKMAFMKEHGNQAYQENVHPEVLQNYYESEMKMRLMAEQDYLNHRGVGRDNNGQFYYDATHPLKALDTLPKIFGLDSAVKPEISLTVHPNGMIEARVSVHETGIGFNSDPIWIRPSKRITKNQIKAMNKKLSRMRQENPNIGGRVIDIKPMDIKEKPASKSKQSVSK